MMMAMGEGSNQISDLVVVLGTVRAVMLSAVRTVMPGGVMSVIFGAAMLSTVMFSTVMFSTVMLGDMMSVMFSAVGIVMLGGQVQTDSECSDAWR